MGTALTILAIIGGVISTIIIGLLKDEVAAWLPSLTNRIVLISANFVPEQDRAQRREEWLAHIQEYPGKLSQFFQAVRLIFAGINFNKNVRRNIKLFSFFYVCHVVSGGAAVIYVFYNSEKSLRFDTWALLIIIIVLASILFSYIQFVLHFKARDVIRRLGARKR